MMSVPARQNFPQVAKQLASNAHGHRSAEHYSPLGLAALHSLKQVKAHDADDLAVDLDCYALNQPTPDYFRLSQGKSFGLAIVRHQRMIPHISNTPNPGGVL
jgi:hypothetical protein